MTLGAPTGEPVLVLHGSSGSGQTMMAKSFAGELFGPGQPLDAAKYFIIIPDAIGFGRSSRPSDGMRAHFPKYSYEDMVTAQYRLVTEHLGIHHLKLVIGQSMGGMHAWMWGEIYPDFMGVLIPRDQAYQQGPLLPDSGIRRDPPSWHLGRSEVVEAPAARFAERGIDAGPVTIVLDLFRGRI
jgi:homoserine acetyltransferase